MSETQIPAVEPSEAQAVTPTEPKGEAQPKVVKPEPETVPVTALTAEREKRQAAEKELEGFRKREQEKKDAEAQAKGDIAAAQSERDRWKSEAEAWRSEATAELDDITGKLDEKGKAILDALGDDTPLTKRLRIARIELSRTSEDKGFGSNGGRQTDTGGQIPKSITVANQYHQWLASLGDSEEGRAMLRDRKKMAELHAEAKQKQLI